MRIPPPSRRFSRALAALGLALLAGCGQKGPLVRPGTGTGTPVVIRGPGGTATAPTSAAPPVPGTAPEAPRTPAKNPGDEPDAPPHS
jgi:predicted small lipoprotein YifL